MTAAFYFFFLNQLLSLKDTEIIPNGLYCECLKARYQKKRIIIVTSASNGRNRKLWVRGTQKSTASQCFNIGYGENAYYAGQTHTFNLGDKKVCIMAPDHFPELLNSSLAYQDGGQWTHGLKTQCCNSNWKDLRCRTADSSLLYSCLTARQEMGAWAPW